MLAPLLGLLGTMVGMIESFTKFSKLTDRTVKFKRGINQILVHLVNGGGSSRFSLLLMPQGAM